MRVAAGKYGRLILTAVWALFAATGWTQVQPAQPFGWDYEFQCELPDFKDAPICTTNALGAKEVVIHFLREMYEGQQYERLDGGLKNLTDSNRRTFDGESPHEAIYDAFRVYNPPVALFWADKWRTTIPSSYFAHFAKARGTYDAAWAIRGGRGASSVSQESWELFCARLDEAERILDEAPDELKSTPTWYSMKMAIVADNPKRAGLAEEIFADAVERWPTNFEFYKYRLTRLTPRWGGSWRHVDQSIRRWSKNVRETEGLSLYARLYVDLIDRAHVSPHETDLDWSVMKDSFDDLVARYPHGRFRLNYAAYACYARDKDTFNTVLASVRAHRDQEPPDASPWLDGNSFEACMVWSGQCNANAECLLHPPRSTPSGRESI